VHHITNWVTIYDCANVTRAVGALPVMAHAPEEVQDMTGISNALVLNIGTLTQSLIDAMVMAGQKANAKGIPVVLDAVGAGATSFRNEKSAQLIKNVKINIVKGNASEIASLLGVKSVTRGVESAGVEGKPEDIAMRLAQQLQCTVVITGATDIVSNGFQTILVKNGHRMMGNVVGTGCMVTSVIASFAAVEKDLLVAASCALACFGIAGELAAEKAGGPGTFKEHFYDALFHLSEAQVEQLAKVSEYA